MATLDLQYNDLKHFSDLSNKSYHKILLDKNYIRYLYSDRLPRSLRHLSVSQNNLTYLEFEQTFPLLENLNVEMNKIHTLYFEDYFRSLKTLNARKNRLKHSDFLCHLPHLEELDLSFNEFETLQYIPSQLKTLKVNFCNLTMIQSRLPSTLVECSFMANSLRMGSLPLHWGTHLRKLNLGQNELKEFPKRLPDSLEELTLQSNKIETIPETLPANLKYLNLALNKIRVLPKKTNVRLEILIVASNELTEAYSQGSISWARDLLDDFNWNTEEHHFAQQTLKKCWKRYILGKRLRHYVRTRKIYEELLMVALHPDHILQTDTFSPEWSMLRV